MRAQAVVTVENDVRLVSGAHKSLVAWDCARIDWRNPKFRDFPTCLGVSPLMRFELLKNTSDRRAQSW